MSNGVHVALVGSRWIEIDEKESKYYPHPRCLIRPRTKKLSAHESLDRYLKRLDKSRREKGSPLKREYDPDANLTCKRVEIDGRSQWVEADWNRLPPSRSWGFENRGSDGESSDTPKRTSTGDHVGEGTMRTAEGEGVTKRLSMEPINTTAEWTHDPHRKQGAWEKRVSFGKATVHRLRAHADEQRRAVRFAEKNILVQDESEDGVQHSRFGGLVTIESPRESRLRRKLLSRSTARHDCKACMDREDSHEERVHKKVSFGPVTIV